MSLLDETVIQDLMQCAMLAKILSALGMSELSEFLLSKLLGEVEVLTKDDIAKYSAKAVAAPAIKGNCKVKPSEDEVNAMFRQAFQLS